MKVMFAGDIHGNVGHLEWLFDHAKDNAVEQIISCGDYGYWPHLDWGDFFVSLTNDWAEENGISFYWIDGNHENHDLLDELLEVHGDANPIPTDTEWVKWIPRGCRFDIDGQTFMGYGGAYSVDWEYRELGRTWWKQELINPDHLASIDTSPVDVLITHDAPFGKYLTYKDDIPESIVQRELVLDLQRMVKPTLHICGHHHVRASWDSEGTQVHVLGRDEMDEESVLIMDFAKKVHALV